MPVSVALQEAVNQILVADGQMQAVRLQRDSLIESVAALTVERDNLLAERSATITDLIAARARIAALGG